MAKRISKAKRSFVITATLLLSSAGIILFGFGFNDWFKAKTMENFIPVIIGAVITYVTIYLGVFKTETAVAMGIRKRK